jgi:hypothetical protein
MGIREEIKRAKLDVNKLNLGFYVQLVKYENILNICIGVSRKINFELEDFLDLLFNRHWEYHRLDISIKQEDSLYKDFSEIQSLRNDFCHFIFDIAKLEEARELLDMYIMLLKNDKNDYDF